MIVTKTPFRISFFGGGTDYPQWYKEHGGAVLATAINKYCYLTCRYLPPFFEHRWRVVWSRIENCRRIDEIQHPVVRAALEWKRIDRGLEIHHVGDLPARSGIGSSSAFTVGLLHALAALEGRVAGPEALFRESMRLEQEILRECIGSQDQAMAAFGGLRRVRFHPSGDVEPAPLTLSASRTAELESHLLLLYTGMQRTAADVAETYLPGLNGKRRELFRMGELVDEAIAILTGGDDLLDFGRLLDEAWRIKRSLGARVTTSAIDSMYERARSAGAVGGKLTGAGGGGFLLLFVPPERHDDVKDVLAGLVHVPFRFEPGGSQVVVFTPEEDYEALDLALADKNALGLGGSSPAGFSRQG